MNYAGTIDTEREDTKKKKENEKNRFEARRGGGRWYKRKGKIKEK